MNDDIALASAALDDTRLETDLFPKPRHATLKDVARRANVSPTTASLFFSGRENVCGKPTADRLRQAAADLNYSVKPARRHAGDAGLSDAKVRDGTKAAAEVAKSVSIHSSLTKDLPSPLPSPLPYSGTYVLGVCIPHDSATGLFDRGSDQEVYPNTFVEQIWRGISHIADGEDCRILHYPRQLLDGESIAPFLQDSPVNGLIMLASAEDPRPVQLSAAGLPVVLVERFSSIPPGCGAVFALESGTAELALSHLWQLKHRRIAHISGPTSGSGDASSQIAKNRLERYIAWMQTHDAHDPMLLFGVENWGEIDTEVYAAIRSMLSLPDCPTAIFCGNDAIAVSACRAAELLGLRIPEDISIIGVDNTVYGAENTPSITSVEIPYEQVGIQAVVQLTRMLEGASPATCRMAVAVTNLVVRESTGPAPRV